MMVAEWVALGRAVEYGVFWIEGGGVCDTQLTVFGAYSLRIVVYEPVSEVVLMWC
jgi:hypothetical protein